MLERVVIINDASVARGGATGLALASARWLREREISVTFIAGDDGGGSDLPAHGAELVTLGERALLQNAPRRSFASGLYNPRARDLIEGWIRRNDGPNVVYHVHGWSKILSPSVLAALKSVADRTVLSAHDFFLACPNGAYQNFRTGRPCPLTPMGAACITTQCDRRNYGHKLWRVGRQSLVNRLKRNSLPHAPILAIHDAMVPYLERGGIDPSAVVALRNPVVPFTSKRILAEANKDILFVGRLDPEKGPDLVAEAARQAGVPLRIVGDGPMREALERRYPEVRFEGWTGRAELAKFAAQARFLAMPSRYPEPFGLVAVEALWSGLPVILTENAFLAGEITNLSVGVSCDTSDARRFALHLKALADNDVLVAGMSRRAFSSTAALASTPARWIDALVSIYESRTAATSMRGTGS